MRFILIAKVLLLCHLVSFSAASSSAPSDWTPSEIERTKARLWTIFKNPIKFVKWLKTPNPTKDCGQDCWDGCDDFRCRDKIWAGKKLSIKFYFQLYDPLLSVL